MTDLLDSDLASEALGVTDVVRKAGVSRPTFYQHFGELSQLARVAAIERLGLAFAQVPDSALGESWTAFARSTFRTLLAHVRDRAAFYRKVLQGPAGYELTCDAIDYVAERLLEESPLAPIIQRRPGPDSAEDRARFLAAGAVFQVARWLHSDLVDPRSIDDAVDRISGTLLRASGATDAELAAVRREIGLT